MIKYTVLAIMTVVALWMSSFGESRIYNDVKSGKVTLVCNDKVISPDRVTGFTDGRWYFDNGSMVQCVTQ